MKKRLIIILFFILFAGNRVALNSENFYFHYEKSMSIDSFFKSVFKLVKNKNIRIDLMSIFLAYPDNCVGIELRPGRKIFIILNNKEKFIYDDGFDKTFEEKLNNSDIQDMLELLYPPGKVDIFPVKNYDPGRFRVEGFFKAIYGKDKNCALKNCITVDFANNEVLFNIKNNAAEALERVNRELNELFRIKPTLIKYIAPINGTFNWRYIAGTKRLSPHSFGIAVDLNIKYGYYWRWKTPGINIKKKIEEFPLDIIEIFEKNGFIWGGKWFHYDMMHFEYRPELLLKMNLMLSRYIVKKEMSDGSTELVLEKLMDAQRR